jgi:formyltetrahydrofolate hydrolase
MKCVGWVGRGASRLVYCVLEAKHHRKELHDELLATFMRHYQAAFVILANYMTALPNLSPLVNKRIFP